MIEKLNIKRKAKKKYENFRVEEDVIRAVQELADKESTTRSEIYRYSIKELLKKLGLLGDKEES